MSKTINRQKPIFLSALLFAFLGTAINFNAQAQSAAPAYPVKPIKLIAPVAAGGGLDNIARAVAEKLSRSIGQTVVVENMGGGGGSIASQATAKAPADGYTLMIAYVGTHGTNPAVRKLPYDALKDFTPIGMIGSTPNVLVVNAALPVTDVKSFIEYTKKNMGKVAYGSAGAGSLTHLTAELFKAQTGVFMVHIPYRGIAPATTDVIAGQTQAMFPGLAAALPHIRNGRLRALAVTGSQRHPALKEVPTMEEAGLKGFDAQQWYGVVGPAGMPATVVTQLNNAMAQVLAMPDLREKLSAEAVELTPMTPAQFGEYMKKDLARWTNLARERNINLDN